MFFDGRQTSHRTRNPLTFHRHQRQVFWQVYFPLIVIILFALSGGALAIIASPESSRLWADIALIFILLLVMFGMTLSMLITALSIILLRRVSSSIPFEFYRLQQFMMRLKRRIRVISDTAVEPFLRYQSTREGLRAISRSLRGERFSGSN